MLDATRGSFLSHAFSFSPSWLGSDAAVRQVLRAVLPLLPAAGAAAQAVHQRDPPAAVRLCRPASASAWPGARQATCRSSERFFAGGSTTLRGFAQNARRADRCSTAAARRARRCSSSTTSCASRSWASSTASLFTRHRQRVPARRRISRFSDLRKSAGVGLRVRTPWFLVRGDYGVRARPPRRANGAAASTSVSARRSDRGLRELRTKN